MVSVCLPSYALLKHLPSYLGFSYFGHGVSLHGCSSKAQWLLLTLDERYCLTAALPDLQSGIAPLGPPEPVQPPLLGLLLLAAMPAGQPKTGGSWWRDLTECGPLEKGMASHFSILALRTPMNSMKRQYDRIPKEELPRSIGAQYATGDQWRNNSRKNEGMEPKQK